MNTGILRQQMVTVPLEQVVKAKTIPLKIEKERSITVALWFVIGSVMLIMTGFAIIIPIFPQRLQALGLGAATLALMKGTFGLGMFLFSTPMGAWSNRLGRKPILFISLAGSSSPIYCSLWSMRRGSSYPFALLRVPCFLV